MPLNYKVTTWDEIVKKTLKLCEAIKNSGFKPDIIVFILRGGATLSSVIADCLGLRDVAAVRATLYKKIGEPEEEAKIIQPLTVDVRGKKVLVLDDVSDTGKTLKAVIEHIKEKGAKEIRVATIHYKPWSIVEPDFYIEETDHWIVYPWEYHEFIDEVSKRLENGEFQGEDRKKSEEALNLVMRLLSDLKKDD